MPAYPPDSSGWIRTIDLTIMRTGGAVRTSTREPAPGLGTPPPRPLSAPSPGCTRLGTVGRRLRPSGHVAAKWLGGWLPTTSGYPSSPWRSLRGSLRPGADDLLDVLYVSYVVRLEVEGQVQRLVAAGRERGEIERRSPPDARGREPERRTAREPERRGRASRPCRPPGVCLRLRPRPRCRSAVTRRAGPRP